MSDRDIVVFVDGAPVLMRAERDAPEVVAIADVYAERDRLRARVAELEAPLAHVDRSRLAALSRAELEELICRAAVREHLDGEVRRMLTRSAATDYRHGKKRGAEAMRERAAAHCERVRVRTWESTECARQIRALPLTDDAREDGGSDGE